MREKILVSKRDGGRDKEDDKDGTFASDATVVTGKQAAVRALAAPVDG